MAKLSIIFKDKGSVPTAKRIKEFHHLMKVLASHFTKSSNFYGRIRVFAAARENTRMKNRIFAYRKAQCFRGFYRYFQFETSDLAQRLHWGYAETA